MRILVLRERADGETRVALVPATVRKLVAAGHAVEVEEGAGTAAGFPDSAYREAGATDGLDPDVRVAVGAPDPLPAGGALVALLDPAGRPDRVRALADRGVIAFALDRIPRTTRAQAMDVLSSMSTLAGYRAVILAAHHSPRLFPLLMTAAGTIPPARVLVIGAGVAGLQAIATARRLGARVEGYDVRAAAREEVESLGARFVAAAAGPAAEGAGGYAAALDEDAQAREREALRESVARADVVITTALVPGRPAPRIVTADMVAAMAPGSVVVDLAAPAGGNCESTRPGEVVVAHGVTIAGPLNLPATMPGAASALFAANVAAFLALLATEEGLRIDFADDIVDACCVAHAGEVRHGA